jgi:DNA repair protein RecN (Recombination protein N)
MLRELKIQNYALIHSLEVQLNPGFTIITGETGAGKSILLGALSLLLGQRADTTVLKEKEAKCIVEADFQIEGYGLKEVFEANDLDYDAHAIFRREINPNGKSRAFINDSPVNLKTMEEIGYHLIDIHSQHHNLELNNQSFQLMVVDVFAGNKSHLNLYRESYREYKKLQSSLKEAEERAAKSKSDLDYFQFQFDQLEKAALVENEQEELEKELEMLTHAEEIKSNLSACSEILNGEDNSTLIQIKSALNNLSRIKSFLSRGDSLYQRLESTFYELKDLADETAFLSEKIEHDPSRLSFVSERLDLIFSLEQKHHVSTLAELISLREFFRSKIKEVTSDEEEINRLNELLKKKYEEILILSKELAHRRQEVIPSMEAQVTEHLLQLGLPNSQFRIELIPEDVPGINGTEEVRFLFTANKNGILSDLSKVASGGELSRVMLAIKALISQSKALPTILFDEIDTGISGEIADKMGNILKEMSKGMQVINITHLPQIAAKGQHHFLVYKQDNDHETRTNLRLLSHQERISELAKMLSGENITQAAILNAGELLKSS